MNARALIAAIGAAPPAGKHLQPKAPLATTFQRRRIWQVEPGMHCSVIGTCLTLGDLHAIARRAGVRMDPHASSYEVHCWYVDVVASPNNLAKLVDKELEKRHRLVAEKVRRAKSVEELNANWKAETAEGHIAGAYWGAMSHPLCSHEVARRFFGEIHMLSHLMGAARRSDLSRLHELEASSVVLEEKLAHLKHDHRALLRERKSFDEERAARGLALARTERRLAMARERVAALESGTAVPELEQRIADLEARLAAVTEQASTASAGERDAKVALGEAVSERDRDAERLLELEAENDALERELSSTIEDVVVDGEESVEDDELSRTLCGKRILCVGGRANLVPHYRALVVRRGGELLHHDGGLEESLDAVTRALATVDAVVCPLDCVSHAASSKVKRACKQLAKRFVPLRTSGLSSFARGLQAVAAPSTKAVQPPPAGTRKAS